VQIDKKKMLGDLIALVAGVILPFAFAPFYIYPLAILSPMLLLYSWMHISPKETFTRGFIYGIGAFGVGVSWIFVSIHEFGNTPAWLAAIFTLLFIMTLSLFPAIQGYLYNKLFPRNNKIKMMLVFPVSVALFEWLRSWVLTGFPWMLLSYSQANSPLKGYIPILGTFGTGFIIALSAALVLIIIQRKQARYFNIFIFSTIWLLGSGLSLLHWTYPEGKEFKVSLIQGNIPQNEKWSPSHVNTTLNTYFNLTKEHWDNDIIIWPEAAIPLPLQSAKKYLNDLSKQAKQHDTALIIGIPAEATQDEYYNSMIALGKGSGLYHKRHLVVFGEYIPFDKYLRGLVKFFDLPMSNFISGPNKQKNMIAKNISFASFVCFEIAFSELVRNSVRDSEFIVTLSNDAWFGDSFAPAQHLQIGQFRALQTGRYLLTSTNNGITAIINPKGQIQSQIPQFKTAALSDTIYAMKGSTPWMVYGDTPIIFFLVLLLLISYRQCSSISK